MWRLLLPLTCPSCGAPCRAVCPTCRPAFPPRLGAQVPSGLDALWCPFAYDGAVKHLVLASKATASHGWLEVMATLLPRPGPGMVEAPTSTPALVTWATGSAVHRRQRGYDPAERLARRYAGLSGLRCSSMLRRVGGPQEGRTVAERSAVQFTPRRRFGGGAFAVLLVDDVVTTGASMSRSAAALRQAGAHLVIGVAFAQREWDGHLAKSGVTEQ